MVYNINKGATFALSISVCISFTVLREKGLTVRRSLRKLR